VWKPDVLGEGYDLGSLGFVGTRGIWAGLLLCSEGEEFVKCSFVVKIHVCGMTVVCRGAGSCPLAILLAYYM
jgi:hypothetical protein